MSVKNTVSVPWSSSTLHVTFITKRLSLRRVEPVRPLFGLQSHETRGCYNKRHHNPSPPFAVFNAKKIAGNIPGEDPRAMIEAILEQLPLEQRQPVREDVNTSHLQSGEESAFDDTPATERIRGASVLETAKTECADAGNGTNQTDGGCRPSVYQGAIVHPAPHANLLHLEFKSAWRRLVKDLAVALLIYKDHNQEQPAEKWVIGFLGEIDCMLSHPVEAHELVVRAHRPGPDGPDAASELPNLVAGRFPCSSSGVGHAPGAQTLPNPKPEEVLQALAANAPRVESIHVAQWYTAGDNVMGDLLAALAGFGALTRLDAAAVPLFSPRPPQTRSALSGTFTRNTFSGTEMASLTALDILDSPRTSSSPGPWKQLGLSADLSDSHSDDDDTTRVLHIGKTATWAHSLSYKRHDAAVPSDIAHTRSSASVFTVTPPVCETSIWMRPMFSLGRIRLTIRLTKDNPGSIGDLAYGTDADSGVDMHDWDYEPDSENWRLVFAGPLSLKEAIVVVRRNHEYPLASRRMLRTLAACPRLESLKIRSALPAAVINQFLDGRSRFCQGRWRSGRQARSYAW
ncbi:hypothetical protein CSOJ01_09920 [Colletotrichum sojae]|uniref:Uncharacterized protein n=1 Tax=Colletotrichum sojae TaxID=2175907 RepID=A0A8H6MQT2_9PEZI|nr:hypothetical protein CSOJ01_09920 [Colletotrichum sojae]